MSWISTFTGNPSGELHFKVFGPAPRLRPLVRYYWVLKCNELVPTVDEYMAPDGFEEIIFSYGGAWQRRVCGRDHIAGGNNASEVLGKSYIVGGKDNGLLCTRLTTLNMIGIKFWPQSLATLLGIPFHSLLNKTLTLDEIQSALLNQLEDRLFDCQNPGAIEQTLDNTLLQWLPTANVDPMVNLAVSMIFNAGGNISIEEITRRCGCHYRTLEKRFREKLGHSPKSLGKTVRFKNIFHSLCSNADGGRKSDLHHYGYYDQSHFSKEFKFFTGLSPNKFFNLNTVSTQVFDISQVIDPGV